MTDIFFFGRFSKNVITLFAFLFVAIFASACDKNVSRPDDNQAETSVNVASFSITPDEIIEGQPATLSWRVTDEKGKVTKVEIAPLVGVVPLSSSITVSPAKTTNYTIQVYVNNVPLKGSTVHLTVLDKDTGEVIDPDADLSVPENETTCDDQKDEDEDSFVDCADSDCAEASACLPPSYKFTDCSTQPTASSEVTVGDPIKITWAGCPFDSLWVSVNGGPVDEYSGQGGTFETTAVLEVEGDEVPEEVTSETDNITEIRLIGRVGGANEEIQEFSIKVNPPADPVVFSAEVSFSVSGVSYQDLVLGDSVKLLFGQAYEVSWTVNVAQSVVLTCASALTDEAGDPVEVPSVPGFESDGELYSGGQCASHTLTVVDSNGLSEAFVIPLTVAAFEDKGQIFEKEPLVMVPGLADGEYYFVTYKGDESDLDADDPVFAQPNLIYKTTDSLEDGSITSFETEGVFRQIHALAASGSDLYLGNIDGLWKTDGAGYKQIAIAAGLETLLSVAVKDDGVLLIGTDYGLYKGFSTDCGSERFICIDDFYLGRETPQILKNPGNSEHFIALTEDGVFESIDNGMSFNEVSALPDFTGGTWTTDYGFLWSSNQIYEWTDGTFASLGVVDNISGIDFVAKAQDKIFVATSSGVKILLGDETGYTTIETNFPEDEIAKFLIAKGNKIIAVTKSGLKYEMDLSVLEETSSEETE